MSQLHLKSELLHNETCRTSRVEIAVKTLMILSRSLKKVDGNREILPQLNFRKSFRKSLQKLLATLKNM